MNTQYAIYVRRKDKKRRSWFMNCDGDSELRKGITLVLKHYKGVIAEFAVQIIDPPKEEEEEINE